MTDMTKSKLLRGALFLAAIVPFMLVVEVADRLIDALPIWYLSGGRHNFIECTVFLVVVGKALWGWLSRRVWIGSLPSHDKAH